MNQGRPTINPLELEEFKEIRRVHQDMSLRGIARMTGKSISTIVKYAKIVDPQLRAAVTPTEDEDIPIDEIVEHRIKQFKQKRKFVESAAKFGVTLKMPGPIGLLIFGDLHLDDDHCDIAAVKAHSDLTHEDGIFGVVIGDTTNNWVGRLAKLYAAQGTNAGQAWKLAEWFFGRTNILFALAGNHDNWSGAGDPLKWIARQHNITYRQSETRATLKFPNGRTMTINARHEHPGHSQWNPAHGVMKAIHMGWRDDLTVAGHIHSSGYGILRDPESGRVCHALQVAAYKGRDDYARDRGFRSNSISPCALAIFDPSEPDGSANAVQVFFDPQRGADYLKWLRKSRKA